LNLLIVGSGAREHALAWKLRQSPKLTDLFIAPGNGGTAAIATNLPADLADLEAICTAATHHRIDLVIVGQEGPIAAGLVDQLTARGIAAFGPSRNAARIESSKAFAKDLMRRHGIPTAHSETFTGRSAARDYVESRTAPLVVKADGLAAGKGVFVCDTTDEALRAVDLMLGDERIFGPAGSTVIVEERLSGREVSAHAFTDGLAVAPMPFSCDYKRVYDGDEGPNTGGMGAYSPPLWLDEPLEPLIHETITEAAVQAMREEGAPYRGVLYPGLRIPPKARAFSSSTAASATRKLRFFCRASSQTSSKSAGPSPTTVFPKPRSSGRPTPASVSSLPLAATPANTKPASPLPASTPSSLESSYFTPAQLATRTTQSARAAVASLRS